MADNKSCEVIGGKRMCGKTTELIKRSSEEHLYILCANKYMAKLIFNQAQDMGLNIPFPLTVDDLPLQGYMDKVLIDEVEMVLQQLIGKRVLGMSTSYKLKELPSLREKDSNDLDATLDIDVSDVLKGLKAVQREARKATAALKELEGVRTDMSMKGCPKCNGDNFEETVIYASGVLNKQEVGISIECVDCGCRL